MSSGVPGTQQAPLDIESAQLRALIERTLRAGTARINAGYQGEIHRLEANGQPLIVKIATGRGLLRRARELTLRREHAAYQRLDGVSGIPRCYGLVAGRYLVLEYIAARNVRDAQPAEHARFYDALFGIIRQMHERGVAHTDLKRRDNILVTASSSPILVDFGLALRRKPGFRPLNHLLFRLGARLDLNAWIKHKYHRDYAAISATDSQYYRPMLFEKLWRLQRRLRRSLRRRP